MSVFKQVYKKNQEKIISTVNFYSNVFIFIGAMITFITSASNVWDIEGEYKNVSDVLTVLSAAVTVLSTISLFWSEREGERLSKIKDEKINVVLSKLGDRVHKNIAEAEKYRYKFESLKSQLLWRDVTDVQMKVLKERLVGDEIKVWLTFVNSDVECVLYRAKIDAALKGTCVVTQVFSGYQRALGLTIRGAISPELEKIYSAFLDAGFPITYAGESELGMGPIEILVGTKPQVRIE
ncbi:hypothetical protein [Citrobacter portucalensis]|uniref:hypothetical protein n=1 Tax=Citrobacter portucalensis TaxID=1639133 RepID=UPI001EDC5ADE|nr:hypothetical protein [Citrobacter portucalensis]MCC2943888.1 hypothetical protein [Citrobacter freundii]UKK90558.1 hypothetical protein L6310_10705 [Citrobacter portucalensis]